MISIDEIQPTDVVLYWTDTITSLCERTRLYGLRKAFKRKVPTNVGVVVEIFGRKMVVTIGKKLGLVPLKNIFDRVVRVDRHVVFANEEKRERANIFIYNEYQNSVEGKPLILEFSKKGSPKYYKTFFVYVVHANFFPFDAKLAKGDIPYRDMFVSENGFIRV